jgi:thiamine pyrophosphate-dependent acetolactate synthase large subunit-like protein
MVIAIYDDAAYGAEVHHFGPQGHAVDLTQFAEADLAAIGRAVGAEGAVVRSLEDLAPLRDWLARREAGEAPTPIVLDIKVEPTVVAAWLEEAFRAH